MKEFFELITHASFSKTNRSENLSVKSERRKKMLTLVFNDCLKSYLELIPFPNRGFGTDNESNAQGDLLHFFVNERIPVYKR